LLASNATGGSVLGASTDVPGPSGASGGEELAQVNSDGTMTSGDGSALADDATTSTSTQVSDAQNADQLAAVGASGLAFGAWYWWLLLIILLIALGYYLYKRYKRDHDSKNIR